MLRSQDELDSLRSQYRQFVGNYIKTDRTAAKETSVDVIGTPLSTNLSRTSQIPNLILYFISPMQIALSVNRPLYEEEWFHGVLPREEVVRLLKNEGDFLVRETTRNEESQIVLSVCWNGHKHFIVQTTTDGHYRFEGPAFPSI